MHRISVPLTTIEKWFSPGFVSALKEPGFEFCSVFQKTQSTVSVPLKSLNKSNNCIVSSISTFAHIVKANYSEQILSLNIANNRLIQLLSSGGLRLVITPSAHQRDAVDFYGITEVEFNYINTGGTDGA